MNNRKRIIEYRKTFASPYGKRKLDNNNLILSDKLAVGLDKAPNIALFGTVRTAMRHIILPNLLQANASYVVTDAGGYLYAKTHTFFEKEGYKVKLLDFDKYREGNYYNPFSYMKKESDVINFARFVAENTPSQYYRGDSFLAVEEALFTLLAMYVWKFSDAKNLPAMLALFFDLIETKLNDIMQKLRDNPYCGPSIRVLNCLQDKGRVIYACRKRLETTGWLDADFQSMTGNDNLELNNLGEERTVLFLRYTETRKANILFSFFMNQLYDTLFRSVEEMEGKPLKEHVTIFFDNLEVLFKIPSLDEALMMSRRCNFNTVLMVCHVEVLKAVYPTNWNTLLDSCLISIIFGDVPPTSGTLAFLLRILNSDVCRKEPFVWKGNTSNCLVKSMGFPPIWDKPYNTEKQKTEKGK